MLKNKPSAVIFDLDGTLVDSALDLTATLNHILQKHGRDTIENSVVRHMIGEGARALIVKGFSHTGSLPTDAEIDIIFEDYLEYYLSHVSVETVMFKGIEKVLNELHAQNIPMAVCTNKNIQLTHALLNDMNIKHYFSAVTCGDSFEYKKPDPRHLYSTCKLMNVDPTRAIMVGDSASDVNAAIAANMPVIGVTFGYTAKPMQELGASAVIDHFNEFMLVLEKLTAHF
ncbi:MAG: phosphoglycolate phosphatase [Kordiimonadaceae bacterium]|jgi:phosphoglycolate phosphatase|nr:phosphoglycolate phosphatase [Kordiimonadaceae bacterium]